MKITREDVNRWSFLDFLTEFISGKPRQKVGYLEVQAGKRSAEILIDHEKKGYTNRSLVMSVGTYAIEIKHPQLSCDTFEVAIRDGATESVHVRRRLAGLQPLGHQAAVVGLKSRRAVQRLRVQI